MNHSFTISMTAQMKNPGTRQSQTLWIQPYIIVFILWSNDVDWLWVWAGKKKKAKTGLLLVKQQCNVYRAESGTMIHSHELTEWPEGSTQGFIKPQITSVEAESFCIAAH